MDVDRDTTRLRLAATRLAPLDTKELRDVKAWVSGVDGLESCEHVAVAKRFARHESACGRWGRRSISGRIITLDSVRVLMDEIDKR